MFLKMLPFCLWLIVGMVLLIKGADFFVSGSSNIARAMKIPTLVIGLTLVSIGTSLPEASVSINSAVSGLSDLSIANVVGSNIANVLLIVGVASIITPLVINREIKVFDLPIMLAIFGVFLIFTLVITPYVLDIVESIVFLVIFVSYIVFLIMRAKVDRKNQPEIEENEKKEPIWKSIIFTVLGIAGIIFGGNLVVNNASGLAGLLGMSEALIGLTIVAVGTSLPELVTSVVAAVKKENDIAIGNVIGSNIFNMVFILGSASTIKSLTMSPSLIFDIIVMILAGLIIMGIALFCKKTKRWQGIIMLLLYVAYVVYIIIRN